MIDEPRRPADAPCSRVAWTTRFLAAERPPGMPGWTQPRRSEAHVARCHLCNTKIDKWAALRATRELHKGQAGAGHSPYPRRRGAVACA